jgi:hypothetical protein
VKESLLGGAKIYIGDNLCAELGPDPPLNEVLTIKCQDPDVPPKNLFSPDYTPDDRFEGTEGNSIRIKPSTKGLLSICDIKVFAKNEITEPSEAA